MLVWGRGTCFENKNTLRKRGRVWEIALSHKIQKSARWKMTLTEFKPTLRLILKLFSIIFGRFSVQGGGSRRLSNPLSIYDPDPYFPEGSGPIFHMALFSTPDHPPLAAAI